MNQNKSIETEEKISIIQKMKKWARNLKKQLLVLYLAYRDERVPWYAKLFTMLVVAYAFSPIDLIPDFIPILGYLDDLILVPLGVYLALKLIPKEVLEDCKRKVEERQTISKPKNWITGIIIITLWILVFVWAVKIANLIIFRMEE
ncbi:YkvA family protein [Bacillus sp. MHSD_36]|uniref:YkvA family protein n=1 Tax=unclassified Bacillus (in: firmicutes) TaxID=185979 RepID=UPI002740FBC5|nr:MULTISPECIES: YkvA family protein [unclassified Bacillus (in: firmicutes)]MDP7988781.1 YkvA family protein [Bacillus sp. MHSD_36]MDR4977943.1 YkvA family protein [Bacillus sp. MHSD_37]